MIIGTALYGELTCIILLMKTIVKKIFTISPLDRENITFEVSTSGRVACPGKLFNVRQNLK